MTEGGESIWGAGGRACECERKKKVITIRAKIV